jgi:hypothetical protein
VLDRALLQPARARLDLGAIRRSIEAVLLAFDRINAALEAQRDPMSDEVVGNVIEAYAYVDRLVAEGIDLFTYEHLRRLLELNAIVLCGTDPGRQAAYAEHLRATETRFFDEEGGGIQDLMEWHASHRDESPWKRAAGIYVRILSKPQLFIEGNHRTGALVMSYLLLREGLPPFVLRPDNAAAFFNPSTLIRNIHKRSFKMLYRLPKIKKRFAAFLEAQADPAYLLPSGSAARQAAA